MFDAQMSDYLANKLLAHSVGETAFTMPDDAYLALYSDDPTAGDVGTELTGVARAAVVFDSAAARVIPNDAEFFVQKLSGGVEVASHWGLRDAAAAGNLLWFGPLYARRYLGGATTEFTITNPGGLVYRYTWTGVGTDPALSAAGPLAGDKLDIAAQNFAAGNNGHFIVVNSGDNFFEVINADGVAEATKTVGTGNIMEYTPTTSSLKADPLDGDKLVFAAGILRLRIM